MKTDERNKFAIKSFLGEYLDLRKDKDNELATVDSIRKGVEFKGANLWILIFAIFMASLGLNVNSTAVIIGAMLISPLMGPIMGVGLSVGLNDFELMKRSLKSFLITTAFSVTTATIFFLLAPIAGSQSELLAREVPDASISIARSKLKEYKLEDTKLIVLQGMNNEAVDVSSIRAMVMEDFYKNSEQRLQQQAVKISQLETTLEQYRTYDAMSRTLVPELKVLYPSITTLSIAHSLEVRVDSMKTDTVTLAVLKFARHPSVAEKEKISEWLKARVGTKKLRLITE